MKTHELTQGTPEWHQHRATHFNASDAPAMLGVSPYKTRSQLLHEYATGITPDVDADTQRRFDEGHRAEALARPLAEQIVREELYPVVGSRGKLSASFDGLTMAEDVAFEHKSLNDEIRSCGSAADLHEMYRVQMEQQLYIAGADKCLFLATKWDGDTLVEEKHFWYEPDATLRARIIKGWEQFEADIATYKPPEVIPAAVAAPIDELPALTVQLVGEVRQTNLVTWKAAVLERIMAINTDLQTDADFATAKKTVSFLDDGEKKLTLVKEQALAQTASIDELFRTIDSLKAEMRSKRLELDKLVAAREKAIKEEIVAKGKAAFAAHIAGLNKRLGKPYMPVVPADFAGAIKGKRTITSLRDAVDTELARARIEANTIADRIQINLNALAEAGHAFLFADAAQIVLKANDDFAVLVKARIAEHNAAEEKRREAERERIRAEEQARAQREAEAKLRAEQEATQKAAAAQAPCNTGASSSGLAGRLDSTNSVSPQSIEAATLNKSTEVIQPAPAAAPKPAVKLTPKGIRPEDDAIIEVLALHYRVHESKVIEWLLAMDLNAAAERMAKEFAA